MALRHAYPGGALGLIPQASLATPHFLRAPVRVEFRRGKDMQQLVAQMQKHRQVLLDAAVAAGKSTEVPMAIAKYDKTLVFHVFPNPLLAVHIHDYVTSVGARSSSVAYQLVEHQDDVINSTGVVFMSAALCVSLMIKHGSLSRFGDVTVFLDEAHESDAYTHIVRTLALEFGAMRLVQSSATFGTSFRERESPGRVKMNTYSREQDPVTWNVRDSCKPWSLTSMLNNGLLFVDSPKIAQRLCEQYRSAGLMTYRLHARMPTKEFRRAMKSLMDESGGAVVLVADSSFISGFTFDVGTVVDLAELSYYAYENGEVIRRYRMSYAGEVEQAAGRCGRIRQGVAAYWRPDYVPSRRICDLESTEAEAAAYLYRCLGCVPIGVLTDRVMASVDLPENIPVPGYLNALYPLVAHVLNARGEKRKYTPVVRRVASTLQSPLDEAASVHSGGVGRQSPSCVRSFPREATVTSKFGSLMPQVDGKGGFSPVDESVSLPSMCQTVSEDSSLGSEVGGSQLKPPPSGKVRDLMHEPTVVSGSRVEVSPGCDKSGEIESPSGGMCENIPIPGLGPGIIPGTTVDAGVNMLIGEDSNARSRSCVYDWFEKLVERDKPLLDDEGYYNVVGVKPTNSPTPAFPNGAASVRRMLSKPDGDTLVGEMLKQDRVTALSLVVARLAHVQVELGGISIALHELKDGGAISPSLRECLSALFQRHSELRVERRGLLSCLEMLVGRRYDIQRVAPLTGLEKARAKDILDSFSRSENSQGDVGAALEEAVRGFPEEQFHPRHVASMRPNNYVGTSISRHRDPTEIKTHYDVSRPHKGVKHKLTLIGHPSRGKTSVANGSRIYEVDYGDYAVESMVKAVC